MSAYYNEHDSYLAQWLRNLIAAGHLPAGDVDERSIEDVRSEDVAGYEQCHFFAGIGGWPHALRLAGWPDDKEVWTGSCPCQPFSVAGKQQGTSDARHLWPAWFRLIRERRPTRIFGEQVEAAIRHGWLDLVANDLKGEGYAVGAAVLPAAGVKAPHLRHRLWFVGHALEPGLEGFTRNERDKTGRASSDRPVTETGDVSGPPGALWEGADWIKCLDGQYRPVEPGSFPLAHGIPARVGRLRAYGNAIVSQLAAQFIRATELETHLTRIHNHEHPNT